MSRRSGYRFADKGHAQSKNLQPFPIEWLGRSDSIRSEMAVVMLRRLATALEAATAALLLAAVTLNFANVIGRYLFGRPIVVTEEILQYANVWIVMLAAAGVTRLDMHLRLDVLLPTGRLRLVRILELAIAALGVGLTAFVVVQGLRIVALTYDVGQRSIAAGIPLAVVYLAIPIGFGCGLVFLLDRAWRLWRGAPAEPEPPDAE